MVVTIFDYNTSPSSNAAWRRTSWGRNCPNLRSIYPGLTQSFNIFTTEPRLRRRRLAFIVAMTLRSIITLIRPFQTAFSLSDIPETLLEILFFFAVWWNLHVVAEIQGSRMVLGKVFKPWHFDWFLYGMAGVHLVFAGTLWSRWFPVYGFLWGMAWTTATLVILLVAWIASWEPEEGGLNIV